MAGSPHPYDGPVTLLLRLGFASCACVAFAACGVRFTASEGNEFFTSIDVSGDRRVGSPLTGSVAFGQNYPVGVIIRCELRRAGELVAVIGDAPAPAHPAGNPEATPFPGNFAFDFTVDQTGSYVFQCYTPKDEGNFIEESFTVGPAAEEPAPTVPSGDPDVQ